MVAVSILHVIYGFKEFTSSFFLYFHILQQLSFSCLLLNNLIYEQATVIQHFYSCLSHLSHTEMPKDSDVQCLAQEHFKRLIGEAGDQ